MDRAGGSPRRCLRMRGIPTLCTPIGLPADSSPATTRRPGRLAAAGSRVMSLISLVVLTSRAGALDGLLPCQRQNPELWFSEQPADLEQAKAHCRDCPVRGSCLSGAVERREPYGVWGGEIFDRGTITAQKRPRGRPRTKVA
jgi:WhiB family redox-sensing transcriptional regulator